MAAAVIKHMASNFAKLDKFEGVDFRRWQKKMHFFLSSMSVVYVLTTPITEDGGDDPTMEQVRRRAKWDNDDYVCRGLIHNGMTDSLFDIYQNVKKLNLPKNYRIPWRPNIWLRMHKVRSSLFTQHKMSMDEAIKVSCIIDKLPPSWKDFNHTLKHKKEELTLVELDSHLRIEESLRVYNDNKGKRKHHDNTRVDLNKKAKPTCWKCGKTGHIKRDCKGVNVGNKANGSGTKGSVDGSSNSLKGQRAIVHVCKDRNESLNDGSIRHMGNESTTLVQGRSCVDLRLNIVTDNIVSAFMSTSKLNDSIIWHARLGHVHFKRMQDISKDSNLCDLHATPSLGNKKYFVTFIDDASRFCYVYLLHTKDEALDKFKVFKTEVELQQGSMIKRFRTGKGGEYMDTLYFKAESRVLGEAMLTTCYLLNRVPNKRNRITPYELWTKRKPNLNYLRVWGCRAVVRLPDPKLKTLGERGIECIFVRYAEHSKAFRFYVIEPNDSVLINSIIESRDAIFDENRFSSVPRPSQRSLKDGTEYIGGSVIPEEVIEDVVQQPEPELRKSKRNRTLKNFRPKF
ncbi:zinc finger, CCHC-type containing protein [Tanacetum coccineum]